jgi:uncharacterized protein (UPF0303 family)
MRALIRHNSGHLTTFLSTIILQERRNSRTAEVNPIDATMIDRVPVQGSSQVVDHVERNDCPFQNPAWIDRKRGIAAILRRSAIVGDYNESATFSRFDDVVQSELSTDTFKHAIDGGTCLPQLRSNLSLNRVVTISGRLRN